MKRTDETLKSSWFQILLSLADHELHGTAIMEEVLGRTDGAVRLWPGTLYGSLGELAERGWIVETDPPPGAPTEGGKRRFYAITAPGRAVLAEETRKLAAYVDVARSKRVLDGAEPV
jgi:DNA-binding PadR family transcriptional regulator